MFTGIIEEIGIVKNISPEKNVSIFEIETKSILKNKKIGDSIAVNGACMTITNIQKKIFSFDVMAESLEKTNLKNLKKSDKVNLESALKLNQSLDGHIVQGHIDATGIVQSLKKIKKHVILEIKFPKNLKKYIAYKGSITINGVSLTISDTKAETFKVDLIPHTLKITNLGKLKKHDKVNLEVDIIARYLETLLNK